MDATNRIFPLILATMRWRKLLAAIFLATAAGMSLHSLTSVASTKTQTVIRATQPLASGTVIQEEHVERALVETASAPQEPIEAPSSVIGKTLNSPIGVGEILTANRLSTEPFAQPVPAGKVAVLVRLSDPEISGLLDTGHRIDILPVGTETATAQQGSLAHSAVVMWKPPAQASNSILGSAAQSTSNTLVVAVTSEESSAIALYGKEISVSLVASEDATP